jgi:tRNA pseudouridine55 synthase
MEAEGIININKEQNMTSHDVVGRVRRILNMKKVGHTGTLDPMATGVLPVCAGRATRIMEYLDMDMKRYRCTMKLGFETDTQDIWGQEICRAEEAAVDALTAEDVIRGFSEFHGDVHQTPPMYSAIKVNGKRLYDYARSGQKVEIPGRDIYISDLVIEDMKLGAGFDSTVTFSVECTKGTYIRSICRDAGENMGVHGTMSDLSRTKSGIFEVEEALGLDQLAEMSREEIQAAIHSIWEPLNSFGEINVGHEDTMRLINGLSVWPSRCDFVRRPRYEGKDFHIPLRDEFKRAYNIFGEMPEGRSYIGVAIADAAGDNLIPDKIFYHKQSI